MSDSFQAFIIIIIFIILYLINILAVATKNVQDNWPLYRCNPMVMPFAGLFGYSVGDTFTACIQEIQSSQAEFLMQPITYGMNTISENTDALNDALSGVQTQMSNMRGISDASLSISGSGLLGSLTSISSIFTNVVIEIVNVFLVLKTLISIFSAAIVTVVYATLGTQNTVESIWNGWPGTALQIFSGDWCFHPNTLIKTQNGYKKIKHIKINDILPNNTRVISTMKISNIDENDNIADNIYEISNGERGEKVLVTGSHLIYDKKLDMFVKVEDFRNAKKSSVKSETLISLITNNHIIPIGKEIYHDWEDKN
jgi:hypothetical protein